MINIQFIEILRTLNRHDVRYVVIGGIAAILWGSDHVTNDIDICYDRRTENLHALVAALHELEARLRGFPDGLPQFIDERTFRLGDAMTFTTKYGSFDCLGSPAGTSGYAQLRAAATVMSIASGVDAPVASIDDLIKMKRTAGRVKDIALVEQLKRLKQIREDMTTRGETPAGE